MIQCVMAGIGVLHVSQENGLISIASRGKLNRNEF